MVYEVEQKYRVDDLAAATRALEAIGTMFGDSVFQSDAYLVHPARDFAKTDEALRIRCDGDATYITYKGPRIDPTTKTRVELELPLPGGSDYRRQFMEMLHLLGFGVVAEVRKTRRTGAVIWQDRPLEVVLDTVEQLGTFVEIEAAAEESGVDAARKCIASLAFRVELLQNERRSYCEMILGI